MKPLRILLFTLAVTAVSTSAQADYRTSFRDGVRAFQAGRLEEAAVSFRRALAQKPVAEASKITVGSRRISYMPNAFLAITLTRLERCSEAIPYFEASENQGIANEAPLIHRQLTDARDACVRAVAASWIEATKTTLTEGRELAAGIDAVFAQAGVPELLTDRAELEGRAERAKEMLTNAASLLDAGRRNQWFQMLRDARQAAAAAKENLETLQSDIEGQVQSAVAAMLQTAQRSLAAAEEAQQELQSLSEEARLTGVFSSNASIRLRVTTTDRQLTEVRETLQKASQDHDPAALAAANRRAKEARSSFLAIADQARSLARDQVAQSQDTGGLATGSESTDDRPADSAIAPPDTDPSVAVIPSDIRAASSSPEIPDTIDGGETPQISDTDQLSSDLSPEPPPADSDDLRPSDNASTGPDEVLLTQEALREAIDAFFEGSYEEVLLLLSTRSSPDPKITAQAHLFRAAASYALYRLSQESDPSLLEPIRSELNRARAADPSLSVPERFFAPPFIALFDAVAR